MSLHKNKKILLVEDTPSLSRVYQGYLEKGGFCVILAETGQDALNAVNENDFEAILLDLKLPDMDGMEVMRRLDGLLPIVMMTAYGSVNNAVEAMQLGARDFLIKPFNSDRLLVTLNNVIETSHLHKIVKQFKQVRRKEFHGFVGSSPQMQTVYQIIESAAPSKATVFITGESGTGKEVTANAIHQESPRSKGAFVPLNCGAIPRDLIESEIFGHIKGSFTGAISDRAGAAKMANGGTLFLDEICEMDLDLQTKLLRFIQTGQYQPVGSNTLEETDIRVVCATNKDPMAEVKAGRFREDLYYRLHVIPIELPSLRERGGDILEIAYSILDKVVEEEGKKFKTFDEQAEQIILAYDWPGNIRELQNMIRNIVVLKDGDVITDEMLPDLMKRQDQQHAHIYDEKDIHILSDEKTFGDNITNREEFMSGNKVKPLWIVEKETIENAINLCDGNIPKAAALLEISPSTIYRKKVSWEQLEANKEDI